MYRGVESMLVCCGLGGGDQELDLGHVGFIMHIRYPSRHAKMAVGLPSLKAQWPM